MKINNRLLEIISFLKENNITTIKEISQSLNLSERSVRYEIDNLNFFLKLNMLPEIKKENMGEIKVNKNFIENKIFEMLKNLSKNSKENRKDYIKFKLLVETTINVTIIAKELDISRTTIKNDLVNVNMPIKDGDDNTIPLLLDRSLLGRIKWKWMSSKRKLFIYDFFFFFYYKSNISCKLTSQLTPSIIK